MAQANIPSEEEVLSYFKKFSNWGRWGAEDQLGAPNLITPAVTKRVIDLVEDGLRITMSRTVSFEPTLDAPSPPVHFMLESGEGWASGDKISSRAFPAATDYFGMIFHGYTVTHVDSPLLLGRQNLQWFSRPHGFHQHGRYLRLRGRSQNRHDRQGCFG
jgi:hypothetical protein